VLEDCGVRWTFQGANLDRLALNPQTRRQIFLLLKEAITNVAQHSQARTASLQLHIAGGELRAELSDDGTGFHVASVKDPTSGEGRGIANMHERAREIGGRLAIESRIGAGTKIVLTVPLRMLERQRARLR
jgi:signal transduction histidine kinase